MNPEELTERCVYWQRVLRLQDWRIEFAFVPWHEIGPEEGSRIEWFDEHLHARIRMCDPSQWKPAAFGPDVEMDAEFVLVHELLHLTLRKLGESDGVGIEQELAINMLTGALLGLQRNADSPMEVSAFRAGSH